MSPQAGTSYLTSASVVAVASPFHVRRRCCYLCRRFVVSCPTGKTNSCFSLRFSSFFSVATIFCSSRPTFEYNQTSCYKDRPQACRSSFPLFKTGAKRTTVQYNRLSVGRAIVPRQKELSYVFAGLDLIKVEVFLAPSFLFSNICTNTSV